MLLATVGLLAFIINSCLSLKLLLVIFSCLLFCLTQDGFRKCHIGLLTQVIVPENCTLLVESWVTLTIDDKLWTGAIHDQNDVEIFPDISSKE